MFGTPDKYEEKNIDSVIQYTCPLEGTEQVNVPVPLELKLSGSPTTMMLGLRTAARVRHPADAVKRTPHAGGTRVSRMRMTVVLHASQEDSRASMECK